MHIYAVGDIHGYADMLEEMIAKITEHAAGLTGPKHLVFLGDYIDRGPNSREVIERLMHLTIKGFKIVCLKGNHEDMLIRFVESREAYSWLQNGGWETCESYGCDNPSRFYMHLPEEHRRWMKNLPVSHALDKYFFAHAGVNPKRPLTDQTDANMMWIRDEFLHHDKPLERIVVHGHTPSKEPEVKVHRIGIDTGVGFYGRLTGVYLGGDEPEFLHVESTQCQA